MSRLAISKDYFPAYARLPRKAQRKADEFLTKFQKDSTAAAIHLEPLRGTVDKQLRSARIGDDYRVILRAPERGDIFLVLWADHHDEAYRWAATKQTAIHPATGSLQIFDASVASDAVAVSTAPAVDPVHSGRANLKANSAPVPTALFAGASDDDLFLAGVPRALLPSVRALLGDGDLDHLLPHLPPESGEVLTALAAGLSLDEALEEVLGRVVAPAGAAPPPPIDPVDVSAALARDTTQRQFKLFEDAADLDAALKHPLDVWRVYLHPRQRRLAQAHTKGPTRVLGGPGTGKTVVALHRAAFLVKEVFKKADDRVLFTTFTVNLAHDLKAQLAKLLQPDDLARVEITNLDAWASTYLRSRQRPVRPTFDTDQRDLLRQAIQVYGLDHVTEDFYLAELRDVILEQDIRTEVDYVKAVRRHRGLPLARTERRQMWPVFAAYRDGLEQSGLMDHIDILRLARVEVQAAAAKQTPAQPRYRSVIVDEVQDFGQEGLRLVRAIAGPERPDDLFLVGDAHQRIYVRPVTLSSCGIQVRGRRSQTLRLNYRTTGAICRWSLGLLGGAEVDDLDDGKADQRGYVSMREGGAPQVRPCATQAEEEKGVVETVKACLDRGIPPEHICVVARSRGPIVDRFLPALERAGVAAVHLDREEPREPSVRLATMHRVKGLEFAVVILVGISKGEVPNVASGVHSEDQLIASQARLRERALLYVAASRARDELYVFFAGKPSEFIAVLVGRVLGAGAATSRGPSPSPA